MALYPEQTILLYGSCASASDKSTQTSLALAKKRAEVVASLICELGVEKERIKVVMLDYDNDPYFEFGRGTGEEGAVNRKVVVMGANSELGQQILAHAE